MMASDNHSVSHSFLWFYFLICFTIYVSKIQILHDDLKLSVPIPKNLVVFVFNNLIMDLVELILFRRNSISQLQCVFILPILIFI